MLFFTSEQAPVQGRILLVLFSQRQGCQRLGQLKTQVEGVGRVDISGLAVKQLAEHAKWIGVVNVRVPTDQMQLAVLCKEPIVVVLDRRRQLLEIELPFSE